MLVSLFVVLSMLIAACGGERPELPAAPAEGEVSEAESADPTAEPEEEAAEEAAAEESSDEMMGDGMEAPMLAEMVAAGDLPPLEERMPANPLVVEAVESVGKHGGTWRRAFLGIKDFHAFGRLNYDPMLRWPRDPKDPVQPGIAESWEWSDDGTELTLNIREGIKWSDGEPFTSGDVLFWWEDIENDPEITPAIHAEWVVAGEPMTVETPDDTTVVLKFAAPNGLAETVGLAFHGNQWPLGFERFGFFAPRHYLEQFHPKYSDQEDYAAFEDAAFDFNVDRPALTPWIITEWEAGATEMRATRNPYYWKVDTEGKQLPYIDELYFTLVEDGEAVNLMALAGDIDMQARRIDFAKAPVFQENAEDGDYTVGLWSSASASNLTFFPNQSYSDPQYRELMQNLNFRQALSVALDRKLMNDVAYFGQATPRTISVVDTSPYFQEDIVSLNAEFDPEAAMALLDEAGLPVGDDGIRTFADGTPIELIVETATQSGSGLDLIEIAVENWNDIGLKTSLATMTRDVYWPKATANEVMIATWGTDRGLVPMVDPIYQFPFDERSWMAPSFGIWYKSGGELGEEPNEAFAAAMALYDQYRGSVDAEEQLEIGKQLVRMSTENVWTIGTVGQAPGMVIVKNDFKNVIADQSFVGDWIIMAPGTQDPSHYYFDR